MKFTVLHLVTNVFLFQVLRSKQMLPKLSKMLNPLSLYINLAQKHILEENSKILV